MLTYQTLHPPTTVLCGMINENLGNAILNIRVTPPNIVMRLLGDLDAAIDRIAVDFKARETSRFELIRNLDEPGVLVNFTTAPLNKVVPLEKFHERALLIDKPYGKLLTYLRAKAQEYLSLSMGGPDWNEVSIALFDAMSQFNLHYQRLITVLQGLDVGIVVGESWEPEYTIMTMKSEVYQLRLLTPFPPQEIKQIAMGLEYDDNGRRIVDFDVYQGRKKIAWTSEKKSRANLTRAGIGVTFRKKLLSRLPAEAKMYLLRLEEEIDKSGPLKG